MMVEMPVVIDFEPSSLELGWFNQPIVEEIQAAWLET